MKKIIDELYKIAIFRIVNDTNVCIYDSKGNFLHLSKNASGVINGIEANPKEGKKGKRNKRIYFKSNK